MGGSGADLAVHDSVTGMRNTLQGLQPSDNGAFFNFDGTPLPW
jgi:hypothetical protein